MRKYRNYTDEDIIKYSKEVKSIAALLRKLDLKPVGGNYPHIKKSLQKLKIETPHWTGQGWNKGEQTKNWSEYTRSANCKKQLIKLRGNKCENCNLTNWLTKLIPIELHHLDGNRTNNNLDNLQLLCCNCHALTKNWKGSKNKLMNK